MKGFLKYYKPYKKLFILDFGAAMLISFLSLMVPFYTSQLIDKIIPDNEISKLISFLAILLVIYIVSVILRYLVDYYGHMLGTYIERDMRQELFNHIQTLPMSFYDEYKTGKLMSALVYDLNEISEIAHHGPEEIFMSGILFIGSFILMFNSNAILATALLILVPLMLIVGIKLKSINKRGFEVLRQNLGDINARSQNSFSGIRTVKAFANEKFENEEFKKGNDIFANSKSMAYKTMAYVSTTTLAFTNLITFVVFAIGSYLIFQGQMQVGQLVAFILFVQLFLGPIGRISNFLMTYNKAIVGYDNFQAILKIKSQENLGTHSLDNVKGEIKFENVSFAYDSRPDHKVIDQLSFTVPQKKTVAIVGPSGGGKTTICSLIPRFYDVNEGSIYIDGINIKDIELNALRSQIGVVQQDVFIFAGTIKENLLYGKSDATIEEIIEACKKADAHQFIEALPNGYDTYIGERGAKLSGGQKQRIAIARVFLKNPPILILDEATSALDNQTERLIQQSLFDLSINRTSLVIAHRLSTIKHADEIIFLTPEGIVERGSHDQLMEKHGHYYHLHEATLDIVED